MCLPPLRISNTAVVFGEGPSGRHLHSFVNLLLFLNVEGDLVNYEAGFDWSKGLEPLMA